MKLLGKLICAVMGHRRGKRIDSAGALVRLQCPRCLAEWIRKERKGT